MTNDSELESAPTQQLLEVPDIYLAELVGVIRRALQADGLTERLWAILDDWCDNQESYLEKKYPEAHEQAESRESVTVDWRGGVAERLRNDIFGSYNAAMKEVANAKAGEFLGLDTFIRTGYHNVSAQVDGVDIPELSSVSPEFAAYRKASDELMERMPNWFIPKSPPFGERDSAIINEMLKAGERFDCSLNDSGITYTSSDGGQTFVAESDSTCTCQAFQGDSPQCAFHGEGTAWYDLHRGE